MNVWPRVLALLVSGCLATPAAVTPPPGDNPGPGGGADRCGDGLDDDSNGRVDDGCSCDPRVSAPCYQGPAGTRGVGACRDGALSCTLDTAGEFGVPGACTGSVGPTQETCNQVDDDCNGVVDDVCTGPDDPWGPEDPPQACENACLDETSISYCVEGEAHIADCDWACLEEPQIYLDACGEPAFGGSCDPVGAQCTCWCGSGRPDDPVPYETTCDDALDNDDDWVVDCEDPDCFLDHACG